MHVTARTDYALRALLTLAATTSGTATGQALADEQHLPQKFLEAILGDLRRAGLVRTRRGPDGGYTLTRPPAEVTVGEVVRAVDGPLASVRGEAPEDLTDEWQVFLGALDGLDQAIKDAGVKPSDFEDGKPPADLSASDKKAIVDAASQIQTEQVVEASSGIEQQGRDVCKVNLGL